MWTDTPALHLSRLLREASAERPGHVAVEDESGQSLSYGELAHQADRLATRLSRWGVGRGDRVGIVLPKSIEAVAAIHGILQSGAAYVPVDPGAPALRSAGILASAGVRAVVVSADRVGGLRASWPPSVLLPRFIVVGEGPISCDDSLWQAILADDAPSPLPPPTNASDPAYILFTSGSTGTPKGVVLSHENAFTFLDWCETAFVLSGKDRFSSHAPFHFDLSVFDLYASVRHAATLILIGENLGKDPVRLGAFLRERRISVWYSAPSILSLLTRLGGIEQAEFPAPRLVLFAGEVFPIAALKSLRHCWPDATLWNLYGPTETNVCTALRIPDVIPRERDSPYSIGRVCPPLQSRVVDEFGQDVPESAIGELVISGPGVMVGYWARPDLTEKAFFRDELGKSWYRTGDLVSDPGDGCFAFHGRRDRMVKKRGYRIELGEVESALDAYEEVDRAAVIALEDPEAGMVLTAFIALKPDAKRSVIALKRHCTSRIPSYMIPDTILFLSSLPMTSTDKVDYQRLKQLA